MPLFESACETCNFKMEWYARNALQEDPPCPRCFTQMRRLISTFAAIFTGNIGRYNDPTKEYASATSDGHFAWRTRNPQNDKGTPEAVWIDSVSKQKEYCRQEGLHNPGDINPNAEVSKEGTSLSTQGMPSSWV